MEPGLNPERVGEFQWGHRNYDEETGRLAQIGLTQQAKAWPTVTQDSATMRKKKYAQGGNPLSLEATNWPTPATRDYKGQPGTTVMKKGRFVRVSNQTGTEFGAGLDGAATNWPTPDSNTSNYSGEGYGPNLREKVANWMTPNTMDALAPKSQEALNREHNTARPGRSNPANLRDQATVQEGITNWPTPQEDDSSNVNPSDKRRETLAKTANRWPTQDSPSIPQAQETAKDGHTCSTSCLRLSPRFVEMLMGLCPGWSNDSEPVEMESFLRWQHLLTENLHLIK